MLKRMNTNTDNVSHKNRLKKIVNKKFTTCFINAIFQFEKSFGHLWGHGVDSDALTDEQKQCREQWEIVRKDILDNGNKQRRILNLEIDLYDINFVGYHIDFRRNTNE